MKLYLFVNLTNISLIRKETNQFVSYEDKNYSMTICAWIHVCCGSTQCRQQAAATTCVLRRVLRSLLWLGQRQQKYVGPSVCATWVRRLQACYIYLSIHLHHAFLFKCNNNK